MKEQSSVKNLTCALSVTIAALLAGCGGSQIPQSYVGAPPIGLQQQMSPLRQPAEGGEFNAGYQSYMFGYRGCNDGGQVRYLDVQGKGNASFLDWSEEYGYVDVKGCTPVSGSFTLAREGDSKDKIYVSVRFSAGFSGTYEVDGGTGKFAKATGSGSYSARYAEWDEGASDFYDDQFTGKINF